MNHLLAAGIFALLLALACGCTGTPPPLPQETSVVTTAPPVPATTIPPSPALSATRTPSVSDNTIIILKNAFRPADMTVTAGSTVRWVNEDDHPHRIEFENKAFTTSTFLLGSSQSFSQRFDRPGSFNYSCMIHPYMQGTISVLP